MIFAKHKKPVVIMPEPVDKLVDTVGAGDAFSSVCIMGFMQGWNEETILQRATAFASRICQQQGATSEDEGLYHRFLGEWESH